MHSSFRNKRFSALTWLVAVLSLTAASFAYGGSVEVTASVLNVRTGPSTSNTRIGTIRQGQHYVLEFTRFSGHRGYAATATD